MLKKLAILFVVMCMVGCGEPRYLKCRDCWSAYKATGGLPGQHSMTCRQCGGQLFETTKEISGLDEKRFQRNGDEVRGISSIGRASEWHSEGHRFESGMLHWLYRFGSTMLRADDEERLLA